MTEVPVSRSPAAGRSGGVRRGPDPQPGASPTARCMSVAILDRPASGQLPADHGPSVTSGETGRTAQLNPAQMGDPQIMRQEVA